eukprot:CAMPEP_0170485148 /NCGR_PEP_ID=MMETSP0208-20121228/4472_1 /TAXON_ID=197538 /ORGANISM="Strombidium inclinatum, Strain S3" /LENGTH=64 /DNA_ID=CAMNT_0010758707 /DNA_START=455 /DNA_END=646 /DNA_ORIENTATION=-
MEEQRKKEKQEMEALEKHQLAVQEIDKAMKEIDFVIKFHINRLAVELTGNKSDNFGNSKQMSLG